MTPSQVGYSDETTYSLKPIVNKDTDDSASIAEPSNSSRVIKTALISTASAAVVAKMASSDDVEKPSVVGAVSVDKVDVKTENAVVDIKETSIVQDSISDKIDSEVADIVALKTDVQTDITANIDTKVDAVVEIETVTKDISDNRSEKFDTEVINTITDIETTNTKNDLTAKVADMEIANTEIKSNPTEKTRSQVVDISENIEETKAENIDILKDSSKGFDELSDIISGKSGILPKEGADGVASSDLETVAVKNIEDNLEIANDLDDAIPSLDIAKTAVATAGAGIIAKVGADLIDDRDTRENSFHEVADNVVKTEVSDDSEEKMDSVANQVDEVITKVTTEVVDNKTIKEEAKEVLSDTADTIIEEQQKTIESTVDTSVGEKIKTAVSSGATDEITEKVDSKLEEVVGSLEKAVNNIVKDDDSESSSLADIAQVAVATAGVGIVGKAGADLLKEDNKEVSEVVEDLESLKEKMSAQDISTDSEVEIVDDLKDSSKGFDELSDIISGKSGILPKEGADGVASSDLETVAVKNIEDNLEIANDLDDAIPSLDIAKTAVATAGAGIIAKVGADLIDDRDTRENSFHEVADNVVKTEVSDDSEEKMDSVANQVDEVITKVTTEVVDNKTIKEEAKEVLSDTADTIIEEQQKTIESTVDTSVGEKIKTAVSSGATDEITEKVDSKLEEVVGSLEKAVNNIVKDDDSESSSLADIAQVAVATAGVGIVGKAGADLLKEDNKEVSEVSNNAKPSLEETSVEDATEEKFTEKLNDLINKDKDSDSLDTADDASLLDIAKTVAIGVGVAGAGVVAKAGAEIVGKKETDSDDVETTKGANKDEKKASSTKNDPLDAKGRIFRRRNMRRFRSSRR